MSSHKEGRRHNTVAALQSVMRLRWRAKTNVTHIYKYKEVGLLSQLHVSKLERTAAEACQLPKKMEQNTIREMTFLCPLRTLYYIVKHDKSSQSEGDLKTGRLDMERKWNTRLFIPLVQEKNPMLRQHAAARRDELSATVDHSYN